MHILITGGTGFIGTALLPVLHERGWQITVLSRSAGAQNGPYRFIDDLDCLQQSAAPDAVINLAGASLAQRRWNRAYKREIVDSRLDTTRSVVAMLRRLHKPGQVLLNASAIGYYGHQGETALDESAAIVPGFAQDLCQRWEEEALQAAPGARVCLLRLGVVLGEGGGALQQMLQPYRAGVASWVGSGEQWLSWVHREDVVRAIVFLLENSSLSGPFNLTAPDPVTARQFSDYLRDYRRTWLSAPLPAPLARLMLGEMAQELLLNGQRVVPRALESAGFEFQYPELHDALAQLLCS